MMAARIRKRHQDDVRAKIKAVLIVNRLMACGMGKVELSSPQVKSLTALLDKVVSNAPTDLNLTGDPDRPLQLILSPSDARL